LFLDEIDALPLVLQGKLLTAIETKRVRRLGAVTERTVDVKLIAATNAVLPEVVAAGRFRADLYHRLAVVVLVLPPLRERGGDIRGLAEALLRQYTAAHGAPSKHLSAEAEAWLHDYAWPGNVRELGHVMERVTLLHMGEEIGAETLMRLCQPLTATQVRATTEPAQPEMAPEHALPAEAEEIRQAQAQTGGNVARAARLLAQATVGELLITPEVGRLVDGWVALEERPLPLHADKPMRVGGYAVVGVNPRREAWAGPRRPSRSPFVGRERELMLLDALLDQVQEGRGQVVGLVVAPGMGKSRLLDEFRQRLTEQPIQWAAGHCLAYGSGIPYLPMLDLLREYCGISVEDDAETRLTKVRARLQQAGLDPDTSLPYLLHLLGLPVDAGPLSHLSAETCRDWTSRPIFRG
jgi:hypothetical protein